MSEIRIDPLTGLRAIVATGEVPPALDVAACDPGGVGPGLASAPLLSADRDRGPDTAADPLFTTLGAHGGHERIQCGAEPVGSLAELAVDRLADAVDLWRERMRSHYAAACLHVCVDERPASGAAAHAELFALDFVPAAIARERERFSAHAARTMGANLLEDIVQEEVRRRERIVAIDGDAVLWCPFASGDPFQLMLAPRRRRERFQDDGPTGASLLHRALTLLRGRFGAGLPLSLWVRSAPRGAERFCWRIDVVPRLAPAGGLALGTGLRVNPVAPEWAATELRELL